MDSVNKTLYIPLRGKAYVSGMGILLHDEMAEKIWAAEQFPLKGRSASRYLAYYMGMRAAVFDAWITEKARAGMTVLHLGCGLDSRQERTRLTDCRWYDLDFPEVIRERRRYYTETEYYRMVEADLGRMPLPDLIPAGGEALVVMEGVSMYLEPEKLRELLMELTARFDRVTVLMDCYSAFAARASKYRNPVGDVGVTQVHGVDDPAAAVAGTGLRYLREHEMTPETMICQLPRRERWIFRKLYAGGFARTLCRIYEFG